MALIPTNDLAAISWIKSVPGIPANKVSSRLPGNIDDIGPDGFVTIRTLSGSSNIYLPVRSPSIEVRTWAVTQPGQKEPKWWLANQLAECIREACLDHNAFGGEITTRNGYDNICVPSAYLISEPRKVESDDARFAIFVFDLQMHWTRRPVE